MDQDSGQNMIVAAAVGTNLYSSVRLMIEWLREMAEMNNWEMRYCAVTEMKSSKMKVFVHLQDLVPDQI